MVARTLINELDGLERDLILVLDDYHLIREQPIQLRFATLTLRYGGAVDSHLAALHAENRYVIDYLMRELRSQVPLTWRLALGNKYDIIMAITRPLSRGTIAVFSLLLFGTTYTSVATRPSC